MRASTVSENRRNGDKAQGEEAKSSEATDQPDAKGGQGQKHSADCNGDWKTSLTQHGVQTSVPVYEADATNAELNWITPLLIAVLR